MKKTLLLAFAAILALNTKAQTPAPTTQDYGKVDKADLEMTACDFEKDANAVILFDKGNIYLDDNIVVMERHTRIKILNDFGKSAANARLEYFSSYGRAAITDLQGETINVEDGKTVITPLDKKLVYNETIDKTHSALTFALPGAKKGSIIEYKYRYALVNGYFPSWYFQNYFPTRYSEIRMTLPRSDAHITVRITEHVNLPFVISIGSTGDYTQVKAVANIPSLPDEQFMSSRADNLQRIDYFGITIAADSWKKIGDLLIQFDDFGLQYNRGLSNEGEIIKKAKALKTQDEKIAFVFDTVKTIMKWNDILHFYTVDGMQTAWNKKTGNSAEINMMVYHLLKKVGINAYPMIVSTKPNARISPIYPNINLFNSTVVYVPIDSTKCYVLDATNKYNLYNEIPPEELNTFGLQVDEDNKEYKPIFLENNDPVMQSVYLNTEINAEGKMTGTAEITSAGYNKTAALKKYKTDGEEKYIANLTNKDNNLKVSSLKLEDMDNDMLPLTQKIGFNAELSGADQGYIIFNTNLFSLMGPNPFINEIRFSDIDFGYRDNYAITGMYKLPIGYSITALPKNVSINIGDGSLLFKRTIAQGDGFISVKYVVNHKKTIYYHQDYEALREFYKQMYDFMKEQIVLKKT